MSLKRKSVVAVDPVAALKAKFAELAAIRKKLVEVKALYQRHDQLVSELLPYFITVDSKQIVMQREFNLGTETFRLVPYFWDEKKGHIVPVVWKSTGFKTVTIG
jgi:hypothetical protein